MSGKSLPTKRPTLRDVARKAGVSVATVSRVLNASPKVTENTRARVVSVIASIGFAPSATARALSSGRSRTIGAIIPTLEHAIFARFLGALETRLADHGYALVVSTTRGDLETEADKALGLLNMGVEGLIVSGLAHNARFESNVSRFDVPVIATSYFDPDARFPTIGYENAAVAEMALNHLTACGHRTIAVVHGPVATNDRTRARLDGIRRAGTGATLSFHEVALNYTGGAAAAALLLERDMPSSAVLCLSDVLALGLICELQRRGLRIPSEISVMGFDDMDWASQINPPLTSIRLPVGAMGLMSADAISAQLTSGLPIQSIKLEAQIVHRRSVIKI